MHLAQDWRKRVRDIALLGGVTAAMYLLRLGCPIRRLTGVPCPGCGMTRALLALLRGAFAEALFLHWMVWSLPVLLLMYFCDGQLFRARWLNRALMAALGTGFLLNWVRHFI